MWPCGTERAAIFQRSWAFCPAISRVGDLRSHERSVPCQASPRRRYPQLMARRVTIEVDDEVAALLAASAAEAQVTEGEFVERALRVMDLKNLVAQIRQRSELDEDAALQLANAELRAARAERAA